MNKFIQLAKTMVAASAGRHGGTPSHRVPVASAEKVIARKFTEAERHKFKQAYTSAFNTWFDDHEPPGTSHSFSGPIRHR